MTDRELLRTTFDGAALLYDEVRPGYPEALFDDVVSLSGIPPEGSVHEISWPAEDSAVGRGIEPTGTG